MKLAVVVSGWHFPLHFYKKIKGQKIPKGWDIEFFCISHREPSFSVMEKQNFLKELGNTRREKYDKILYEKIATEADIIKLGWNYKQYPNTIGDWGNSNQWLEENNYKKYDLFLFSHDDNFILTDNWFEQVCRNVNWLVATNALGNAKDSLRGSCEFFTKEMLKIIGGRFDLSDTTLTREGEFTSADNLAELSDWNTTVYPFTDLIRRNNLQKSIVAFSPYYRVSKYCIEGERGFIYKTDSYNTAVEEKGFDMVDEIYHADDLKKI